MVLARLSITSCHVADFNWYTGTPCKLDPTDRLPISTHRVYEEDPRKECMAFGARAVNCWVCGPSRS